MTKEYVGIDLHRRRSVIVRKNADGEVLSKVHIDNQKPSDDRPDGNDGLVNIAWVAKALDVTPRYVRRLVAQKRMPYVKLGRLVRFERSEVYRFISERRIGPAL